MNERKQVFELGPGLQHIADQVLTAMKGLDQDQPARGINCVGYHDTHDTMSNIDLDYGAAVAAIAIESVARASTAAN